MSMPVPPPAPAAIPGASRRTLLKLGMLGLAGTAASPALAKQAPGFTHNVASGEPGASRVLLWTRFVAPGGDIKLTWELSESADFARIAASGEAIASPERDWCAKAWAEGLRPGTWYFYRFVSPYGDISPVGRTRTLPVGKTARFKLAVFSCSNYGFGFFNAYAHAAEQGDFDLAVHLGDYFYEYERGEYPSAKQVLAGRELPEHETVTLAQYRARFALYRSDPDLQRLHQVLPMITVWDDHETANDSWKDGAENHQSDTEGDWAARKAAAQRAYREWLPVSDEDWASYEIGNLATLLRLETRLVARDKPLSYLELYEDATPEQAEAAIAKFRDGAWRDPARELLGARQQAWLAKTLKASAKARKPWQVLAQQIIMGKLVLNAGVLAGMPADTSDWLKARLRAMVAAGRAGVPLNMDAWDGYPAARERLFKAALEANANLVVLTGDTHNAWAFDLDHKGKRVGVEMAGHSVTSPGAESNIRWMKPDELARESVAANRQLKWCDTSRRGYMAVELTPKAATSEWRFMATIRQKGTALAGTKRMTVLAGQRRFESG
jgi:alkaline phosphatase D